MGKGVRVVACGREGAGRRKRARGTGGGGDAVKVWVKGLLWLERWAGGRAGWWGEETWVTARVG